MRDRLTLPWAILALLIATALGIGINRLVASPWIAPLAMALLMISLFLYGRIPAPPRDDTDN